MESNDAQADINRLTLQLMVSTNKYKKYLAKQDPGMLEQLEIRTQNVAKYKSRIMALARDLASYSCSDTETRQLPAEATTELRDIMERFVDVALAHIKTLDETKFNETGLDLDETKNDKRNKEEEDEGHEKTPQSSLNVWGPTLHRFGYMKRIK